MPDVRASLAENDTRFGSRGYGLHRHRLSMPDFNVVDGKDGRASASQPFAMDDTTKHSRVDQRARTADGGLLQAARKGMRQSRYVTSANNAIVMQCKLEVCKILDLLCDHRLPVMTDGIRIHLFKVRSFSLKIA